MDEECKICGGSGWIYSCCDNDDCQSNVMCYDCDNAFTEAEGEVEE